MIKEFIKKIFLIMLGIISPTYYIAKLLKDIAKDKVEDKDKVDKAKAKAKAYIIKTLNTFYLLLSIIIVISITIFTYFIDIKNSNCKYLLLILFCYSFSRVNEVFISFLIDAEDKMKNKPSDQIGLKYYERIRLAFKSYIELILDYGIIYYCLYIYNNGHFKGDFKNISEAIYFSASTITTLGYGDFSPTSMISQIFTYYEVISGFTLIVISFTVYISLNFRDKNNENKIDNEENEIFFDFVYMIIILLLLSLLLLSLSLSLFLVLLLILAVSVVILAVLVVIELSCSDSIYEKKAIRISYFIISNIILGIIFLSNFTKQNDINKSEKFNHKYVELVDAFSEESKKLVEDLIKKKNDKIDSLKEKNNNFKKKITQLKEKIDKLKSKTKNY